MLHLGSWELIKPGTYFKESKEIEKCVKMSYSNAFIGIRKSNSSWHFVDLLSRSSKVGEKSAQSNLTFVLFLWAALASRLLPYIDLYSG